MLRTSEFHLSAGHFQPRCCKPESRRLSAHFNRPRFARRSNHCDARAMERIVAWLAEARNILGICIADRRNLTSTARGK